ncbi:biopolymer transporter ExbB [Deferribacterales bacterium]|nr:biopolymer transporter ExbB [Deferribacterales bacterium]
MYPILGLSVVALGIFLERLWVLRPERFIPVALLAKLKELLGAGNYNEAASLCAINDYAITRIAARLIEDKGQDWQKLSAVAEEVGSIEARELASYQSTLLIIVALEPLLGLLGTVFAMIDIFNVMSTGAIGDGQALSGGIALALITTAAGISIAIPVQVFHHIAKYMADKITNELERQTIALIELIK